VTVGMLQELDREMPEEPGPDWNCAHCSASFQSERMFNLHVQREHLEVSRRAVV